jgi:hypothetical protein
MFTGFRAKKKTFQTFHTLLADFEQVCDDGAWKGRTLVWRLAERKRRGQRAFDFSVDGAGGHT